MNLLVASFRDNHGTLLDCEVDGVPAVLKKTDIGFQGPGGLGVVDAAELI